MAAAASSAAAMPDDLDITSIGALYRGPWDKKYWSSSRGKDRYPYPVGYHAVRTHAGSTYRMEIHEGLKGPEFVVTSIDGNSCAGHTPDIAWQNFQKKSGPSVKNWPGKRFSCKIDGVELFGFRNPFVQRLLRELVANVNGIAERSLLSSNFCNRASQSDSETRMHDSHAYPDLLPYLGKQQSTGNRTKKNRSFTKTYGKEVMLKRIRCDNLLNNAEGDTFKQADGLRIHAKDNTTCLIEEENMFLPKDVTLANSSKGSVTALNSEIPHLAVPEYQNIGTPVNFFVESEDLECSSMHLNTSIIVEKNCRPFLTRDKLLMKSGNSDYFAQKGVIPHEQIEVGGFKNTYVEGRLPYTDKVQLDRLSDAELQQGLRFTEPKHSVGEITALASCSDAFVPDTCDSAGDDDAGFVLENTNGSSRGMKHELAVAEPTLRASRGCTSEIIYGSIATKFTGKRKSCSTESMHPMPTETCPPLDASKGLINDSLSEVGSSSDSPNPCSGRIDLDLAGQELAKSMMTFLLPRAVPLLKKTYVKRKSRHQKRDIKCDPCLNLASPNSLNAKSDQLTVSTPQGKPVTDILPQELEDKVYQEIIKPPTILGVGSLCKVTKLQSRVSSCPTVEPNTAKDVKFIVQDSFEDDKHFCNIAISRPLSSAFDEAHTAQVVQIEHNDDTSKLPINHTGDCKESSGCDFGNYGCENGLMQPEEFENVHSVPSDSFAVRVHANQIIPFKKESNENCRYVDDKTSRDNHGDIPSLHPSSVVHDSSLHPDGDSVYNTVEKILLFDNLPVCSPLGNHKAEPLEENPPTSSHNCRKLGNNEVLMSTLTQSYSKKDSQSRTFQSTDLHKPNNVDLHPVDSRGATLTPQMGFDGQIVVTGNNKPSFFSKPNVQYSTFDHSSNNTVAENLPHTPLSSGKYNVPLSESIVCRYSNDNNDSDACIAPKILKTVENGQVRNKDTDAMISMLVDKEVKINKDLYHFDTTENVKMSESSLFLVAPCVFENHDVVKNVTGDVKTSTVVDPSFSHFNENGMDVASEFPSPIDGRNDFSGPITSQPWEALYCSDKDLLVDMPANTSCKNLSSSQIYQKIHLDCSSSIEANSTKKSGGTLELVGCYLHPLPVLSIFVSSKEDHLHISVLCGLLNSNDRNLFMYTVPIKEQRGSCPSFLGYTSLVLPLREVPSDGNISLERLGLQFSSDEQSLIFLNNIKAPHCREQNISCLCSNCKSDIGEENAVEVARVKFGYISLVAKLTTVERVSCILVCDPNYLIAAEESGRLHVWIMDKTWSMNLEDYMLPYFDHISPALLELKRIPKCDSLIVGHNGRGGFGLWDISQRVLLASFSSPGDMIFQIVPIKLSSWQDKDTLASYQDHGEGSVPTTNNWLPKTGENHMVASSAEDLAVWLLVSSASDSEVQHDQIEQPITSLVGRWRLAMLAKNTLIVGSMLDPRASAIDASADYGIIGTCDGLLYKWELSTGEKLANVHSFKCGVSGIASDAKSGALVVACDKCQLLIYVQR